MKKEKKEINILTVSSISNRNGVKTFIKYIVNYYLKGTR